MDKFKNIFSRKFILSLCIVVAGLGAALQELAAPEIRIAGLVIACVSGLAYNIVEGKIDAEAVKAQILQTIAIMDEIKNRDTTEEEVEDHG